MASDWFRNELRKALVTSAAPVELPEELLRRLERDYLTVLASVDRDTALAAARHAGARLRGEFAARRRVAPPDMAEAERIVRSDCPLCT